MGDSLVEILLFVSVSVPADRRCQVFNSGSFRKGLMFDKNVLPAHMQSTALKTKGEGVMNKP